MEGGLIAGQGSRFHKKLSNARWSRTRQRVLDAASWRCARCGKYANEVHHRVPLHRGGAAFDKDNLEPICRGCHIAHHRPPLDPAWVEWKAGDVVELLE